MQEVQELVKETKDSLVEYLGKLVQACDDITNQIQESQESWVNLFHAMVEGIDWVIQAAQGIQNVDQEALPSFQVDRITALFEPLNGALETDDMVLFTDLIQYELKPVFVDLVTAATHS